MHIRQIYPWNILALAMIMALTMFSPAWAQSSVEVLEVDGQVEWAAVPPDLGPLEAENKVTVRALRGFGLLPESYGRLALELRQHKIDLLAAGAQEIREVIAQVESGALDTDPDPLRDLLTFLENKNYYDWRPLTAGTTISLDTNNLIRGQGQIEFQDADGQKHSLQPGSTIQPLLLASASETPADTLSESEIQPEEQTSQTEPETETLTGLSDTAQFELVPLPKTWTQAPGMYRFGPDVPLQGRDCHPHWSRLSAICPTPDNGHVIVGSVNTSVGLQAWVIRYDAQGMPQWSRQLGGDFNLFATAIAPLGQDGFLIGGSMETDRPGFFIALDNNGHVLWSRTTTPESDIQGKETIQALATQDQSTVAVGQIILQDENKPAALIMAVPTDGTVGWRTVLSEGTLAQHVIAVKDGWIVGGQAANAQTAWVAKVDTQGQLIWSQEYEHSGTVAALVATADGQILASGHNAQTNQVWLLSLLEDGTIGQRTDLDLMVDNTQVARALLDMTLGPDNKLWLAGESVSDDGWLAKIDPSGQIHWVQIYGQDDHDALAAVLANSHGATAIGHSFAPDSMHGCALWVLNVDKEGQPLTAPDLSADAQALFKIFNFSPNIHVKEGQGQTMHLALPFVSAQDGLLGLGMTQTEIGQLTCTAQPVAKEPGRWNMTVNLPDQIFMRDFDGSEAGTVTMTQPSLSFVFDTELNMVLALDGAIADLDFKPQSPMALEGLYHDLGLEPEQEEADTISLAQIMLQFKLEQDSLGLWGGPVTAELTDWCNTKPDGKVTAQLGKVTMQGEYKNLNLTTLRDLTPQVEAIFSGEADITPESISNLAQIFVKSMGINQGMAELTDFAFYDHNSEDHVLIKSLSTFGGTSTPSENALLQDVHTDYVINGLTVLMEGADIRLDQASVKLRAERLAWDAVIQAGLDTLFAENETGGFYDEDGEIEQQEPQQKEPGWQQWISKILGGFEIALSMDGLNASLPELTPLSVGSSSLRFSVSDLDTPAAGASLTYAHEAVTGVPVVPEEIMPDMAKVDVNLENVPFPALLSNLMNLFFDPFSALSILADSNATLNINTIDVNAPLGGLRLAGQGLVESLESKVQPNAQLKAELSIRNFQELTKWFAGTMDNTEAAGMLAIATVIQLAGVEEKGADNDIFHNYKIELDSQGKMLVNGKDLSALLGRAVSEPDADQTEKKPTGQ